MHVRYEVIDRYELTCPVCSGRGCLSCRNGSVPVYVVVTPGRGKPMCGLLGHNMIGHTERATEITDLPHVAFCVRCTRQQIHTDVPEAYDLGTVVS